MGPIATTTPAAPRHGLSRDELALAAPGSVPLGYDAFGLRTEAVGTLAAGLSRLRRVVAVRATGLDAVPSSGPAVLFVNHAGPLPVGALALATALLLDAPVPRVPRVELEPWAVAAPWVGHALRAIGHVTADPRCVAALLERGELVVHAPPAARVGRGSPLGPFRRDVLKVAARARAPVIPAGIAGAERILPVARLDLVGRLLGARSSPFVLAGLPRRGEVRVAFGRPRRIEALEATELDARALELEEDVARLLLSARAPLLLGEASP